MNEEITPLVALVSRPDISKIDIAAILEQLLFASSCGRWLSLPDPKPDMHEHHIETLQQAFGSCLYSGAFEDFYTEQIAAVYEALTGKSYEEFEQELMK